MLFVKIATISLKGNYSVQQRNFYDLPSNTDWCPTSQYVARWESPTATTIVFPINSTECKQPFNQMKKDNHKRAVWPISLVCSVHMLIVVSGSTCFSDIGQALKRSLS